MTLQLAETLMREFAQATGVIGGAPQRRYLWTDAFAVCNYLGLARQLGNDEYLDLARTLVDQVHHTLGRHREDDARRGWISGLADADGEQHPTQGGLRIGKPLPERPQQEPVDSRLEWERDGQYFHYLAKWMHALRRMHAESGEGRYRDWAVELAITAHRAFTRTVGHDGLKRMAWKMSVDLRRPLVASMGQHDPLDGLITALELLSISSTDTQQYVELTAVARDYRDMCDGASWHTDDPLGLGGLLDAAARLSQLTANEDFRHSEVLWEILDACNASLPVLERTLRPDDARQPRLAFRELGLSIGLHAIRQAVTRLRAGHEAATAFQRLLKFEPLASRIENWWSELQHRTTRLWQEHADINNVMLATSLAPAGYVAT